MQHTGIQTLERQRSTEITKQRMRFVILEESMIIVQGFIIGMQGIIIQKMDGL